MKKHACILVFLMLGLSMVYGQTDSLSSSHMQDFRVGDTILIKKETTRYLTGEQPSRWVYYVKHTIQNVGSKRFPQGILIKGILSWVGPDNIVLVGTADHRDMTEEAKVQQQEQLQQLNEEIEQLSDAEKVALARYAAMTKTEVITKEDVKPEPVVKPEPAVEPEPIEEPEPIVEPEPEPVEEIVSTMEEDTYTWHEGILIKTNLLYDLATVANLGLEFGFGEHYSIDLPFCYSPYTVHEQYRVRTFLAQPEFRYWFKESNRGHFLGLHGIVALFNVSAGESLRFQTRYDLNGHYHPLLGVGLSYGYSLYLDKKERWGMEFTIGVGYAYIQYDKFYNVENGARCDTGKRHYGGPTKLGITLSYRFADWEKKTADK